MKRVRKALTLVELLVVIGIITLLLVILMPALSRARKSALSVSCGSNQRQITYAAIAYGNDWKEALPTLAPARNYILMMNMRLPIIGFDSTTAFDPKWEASPVSAWPGHIGGVGGWSYVFRDYLKNDWDVTYCPDGWFKRHEQVTKDTFWPMLVGFLLLPNRPGGAPLIGGESSQDKDEGQDRARRISDLPALLVMLDFNMLYGNGQGSWNQCNRGGPSAANHLPANISAGGNWIPSQTRSQTLVRGADPGTENWPRYDREDYRIMPMGQNQTRLDAQVTWLAWPYKPQPRQYWPLNPCYWAGFGW